MVAILVPASARAQALEFPVGNFQPAASTVNYFVTESGFTLPHLSPSAQLIVSYAHRPLAWYTGADKDLESDLIAYRVNLDVMVAFGLFDRVELGVAVPVTATQGTDGHFALGRPADDDLGAGVGDIRIIPKVRIATVGPVTFGASVPISVPSGDGANLLGSASATFMPKAIMHFDSTWVDFAVNFGVLLKVKDDSVVFSTDQDQVTMNHEFRASAGVKVALWQEKIDLVADVFMGLGLEEQNIEEVPVELLGGFKFYLPAGFHANVGAGPGLTRGIGTPVFRVFGGLGYQYVPPDEPPPPPAEVDTDGDGIPDKDDKCPMDPEDKDGFEDQDGCPDLDNDRDGILDKTDKCPMDPEDKDDFEDLDGCPDLDNDKDGILDKDDRCPVDPEDKDGFEDADGCPDTDNDNDGIPDSRDKCPMQPETFNNVDDDDGCPDKGKGPVNIVGRSIEVPPVYFATNRDVILKRSFPTLQQVADLLKMNKWVKLVRIEGHTDDRGTPEYNLDLSQRRANSVMKFLLDSGIEKERLYAKGFGETQPVETNNTAKGRAANRRVAFIIVKPATAQKKTEPKGPPPRKD